LYNRRRYESEDMKKKAIWISRVVFEKLREVADEEEMEVSDLADEVLLEYADAYWEDEENGGSEDNGPDDE